MKLYRVWYSVPDMGSVQSWHTSKREAAAAVRAFVNEREQADRDYAAERNQDVVPFNYALLAHLSVIDFPTKKAAIVKWLNAYVSTDNG